MDKQTVKLTIKDKQHVLFNGIVDAVSSYNDKGIFDILARHENFITLVRDKIVVHSKGKDYALPVEGGIIKVSENIINLYLGLPSAEYVKKHEGKLMHAIKELEKRIISST